MRLFLTLLVSALFLLSSCTSTGQVIADPVVDQELQPVEETIPEQEPLPEPELEERIQAEEREELPTIEDEETEQPLQQSRVLTGLIIDQRLAHYIVRIEGTLREVLVYQQGFRIGDRLEFTEEANGDITNVKKIPRNSTGSGSRILTNASTNST